MFKELRAAATAAAPAAAHLIPLLQLLQERELQAAVQGSTVEQLKTEVSALQAERGELDSQQRRLDKEMETLNTHTSARTQLDMLKKEKVSDEDHLFFQPGQSSER